MLIVDILMRYVHVLSAVLAVGGAFFISFLLPRGLRLIEEPKREEVLLKVRRAFKMTVHPAILGLLVSGVYNTVRNWDTYKLDTARNHALWGPHLLLGLTAIAISLWLLAGRTLRPNHTTWMRRNVILLLIVIGFASALRSVRLATVKAYYESDGYLQKRLETNKPSTPAGSPAVRSAVSSGSLPATTPVAP